MDPRDELPRLGTPEDRIDDRDFGDLILTGVEEDRPNSKSWGVRVGSTCFGIPKAPGVAAPEPGDRVRMWPAPNFGRPIRGVALRGVVVHYRTEAEHKEKLAEDAAERDRKKKAEWESTGRVEQEARYEALPDAFQARIDKYRANNPDFGWQFESYELFCCEQAVVFARRAAEAANAEEDRAEVNAYFAEIGVAEVPPTHALRWLYWWANERDGRADRMPGMDAGHSGMTFGTAFDLAVLWLEGNHDGILKRYGAMAPLVGSESYGDIPLGEAAA